MTRWPIVCSAWQVCGTQGVAVLCFTSVLIEQWIRAKYERKEFLDSSQQTYLSGHKQGELWKRGKASDKFAPRLFILSEANNSLIYFNKANVCDLGFFVIHSPGIGGLVVKGTELKHYSFIIALYFTSHNQPTWLPTQSDLCSVFR